MRVLYRNADRLARYRAAVAEADEIASAWSFPASLPLHRLSRHRQGGAKRGQAQERAGRTLAGQDGR